MPTKAFVSYCHEDREHEEWVLEFATRLCHDGVEATLDQWELALGDQIAKFMEMAIRENDFVLIVCTPRYKERCDTRTGGVGYEGDMITAEVLSKGNHRKFIPILRKGDWDTALPSSFSGKYSVDLRGELYSELQYQKLLTTLLGNRARPPAARAKAKSSDDDDWNNTWRSTRMRAMAATVASLQTNDSGNGKREILENAGFVENHIRGLWFNRSTRMIFSHELVRDHKIGWLKSKLQEQVPEDQFWFYFNAPPARPDECQRILQEMGLSGLTAIVKAPLKRNY
jgi:hypothetical protein